MQSSYSQVKRIKHVEGILEKIAYLSIVLDVFVGTATFLALRNVTYSSSLLRVGDYLIFLERLLAVLVFVLLMALKHYNTLMDSLTLLRLRKRRKEPQ